EARRLREARLRGAALDDDAEVARREVVDDPRIVDHELDVRESKTIEHRIADTHRRQQASGQLVDPYCHRARWYIQRDGAVNALRQHRELVVQPRGEDGVADGTEVRVGPLEEHVLAPRGRGSNDVGR